MSLLTTMDGTVQEAEEDGDADSEQASAKVTRWLRMYERSKLRWYFAIAIFDSAATAARVYSECDGHEFQESTVCFDLRFVPDAEDFSARTVRPASAALCLSRRELRPLSCESGAR